MTPDQINIAILLLEYAGWCTLFGSAFAVAFAALAITFETIDRRSRRK